MTYVPTDLPIKGTSVLSIGELCWVNREISFVFIHRLSPHHFAVPPVAATASLIKNDQLNRMSGLLEDVV